MPFSKNQQTSHVTGGLFDATTIAQYIAAGYTNAQLAVALGITLTDVVRALALATPT